MCVLNYDTVHKVIEMGIVPLIMYLCGLWVLPFIMLFPAWCTLTRPDKLTVIRVICVYTLCCLWLQFFSQRAHDLRWV